MIVRVALVLLIAAPASLGARSADPVSASGDQGVSARAWVARVEAPGGIIALQIADSSATLDPSPHAWAVPTGLGGSSPLRADATPDSPDDVRTPMAYADPTGSLVAEGQFSEAHVTTASATARAGVGSMTGSGFATADMLLTWEQQEEMLTQWMEVNAAVFTALNGALQPLAPVLALAGVRPTELTGIDPIGFVDFAGSRQLASSAETSWSPGLASSRADATFGEVRMLGGFLQARGVTARATSEAAVGAETRTAGATIGSLRLAGIEVAATDDGLRVVDASPLSRAVVQPALDLVLDALDDAGATLRVAETTSDATSRRAVALELEVASPDGSFTVSLGGAEAEAPTVTALSAPAGPAAPPLSAPAGSAHRTPRGILPGLPGTAPLVAGPVAQTAPAVAASAPGNSAGTAPAPDARLARGAPLGESAARAARTAFLLLVVGGLAGAIVVPLLAAAPRAVPPAGPSRSKETR